MVGSFSASRFPALSRPAYRWELRSAFFIPTAIACVEGNVIGVIADKAFQAPDEVIALLTAAPALANIASILWTRLFHGYNRVAVITAMQCLMLLGIAIAAIAPFNNVGLLILVAGVLIARFAYSGVLVARTDVWRANYTRDVRARAAGKFATINSIVMAATGLTIGTVMDLATSTNPIPFANTPVIGNLITNLASLDEHAYRAMFAICIITSALGVWLYAHIRWRGAASHLAEERTQTTNPDQGHAASPKNMVKVLFDDANYRRYQIAQFILGISNIAAAPIFIIALSDTFTLGYTQSLLLTQILPILLPVASIPIWARLLGKVHVARFRMYHSWFFVAALAFTGVGFMFHQLPFIYAARITLGIAFGGGMLAWTLGHHDFASRQSAPLYMGIHASLTGVRGVIAPFIGIALYALMGTLTASDNPTTTPLQPTALTTSTFNATGMTFLLLAALASVGAIRFFTLAMAMKKQS